MLLKPPDFWQDPPSFMSHCLKPLSLLYQFLGKVRYKRTKAHKITIPVICVGNLVMGGAGKTPTVIAILDLLRQIGFAHPHVLCSGYGAIIKGIQRVDPLVHDYLRVGDVALLLSAHAPTWAGRNRVKSACLAQEAGADIIVMDDGFQNNSLYKDYNILVIDNLQGFGNQCVFPAGPLREPIHRGLSRANAVVEVCYDYLKNINLNYQHPHRIQAVLRPESVSIRKPVVAFAGLGYPQKFKNTLEEKKIVIKDFITFADHYPYTLTDMQRLLKIAAYHNAILITTTKDYIRIPPAFRVHVHTLAVFLEFTDAVLFKNLLKKSLNI